MAGRIIAFLVLVGACLVVSIILIYQIGDTQIKQTYAQAALVSAQGQARLDSAQAASVQAASSSQTLLASSQAFAQTLLVSAQALTITMTAALPWFVLGLLGLGVLGVAIMGIIVMVTLSNRRENRIVYLPPPRMPRIEVWRALEDMRNQGFEVEVRHGQG